MLVRTVQPELVQARMVVPELEHLNGMWFRRPHTELSVWVAEDRLVVELNFGRCVLFHVFNFSFFCSNFLVYH